MRTRLAALPLLLLALACTTTEDATHPDDPHLGADPGGDPTSIEADAGEGGAKAAGAPKAAAKRAPDAWPIAPGDHPAVSVLHWIGGPTLQIGYANATVIDLDLKQRNARTRRLGDAATPIRALSPSGRWAVVDTAPATLVDLESSRVLMELLRFDPLATDFASDESRWYVSDKTGRLHIWKREKLMGTRDGEDLRAVLERAQPTLSAALPSPALPLVASGPSLITFANDEGDVLQWDVTSSDILTLMSLNGRVQHLAATPDLIAATSDDARLRVFDLQRGQIPAWSLKAQAQLVALAPDSIAAVYERRLQLLDPRSGEARWTTPLPEGRLCGLAIAPDATVALCIGGVIGLFDPASGLLRSALAQSRGAARWVDPDGKPLP